MVHPYPLSLRPLAPEEGGGWLAEVPDLPGCLPDGATPEDAVRNVQVVITSSPTSRRSRSRSTEHRVDVELVGGCGGCLTAVGRLDVEPPHHAIQTLLD